MIAPSQDRELWKLIDSVRDRSYNVFVFDEKRRMHDLVVGFKARGIVSQEDIEWLKHSDANLREMGISPARFERRMPYAKRRRARYG